jgi:hypothetical protein
MRRASPMERRERCWETRGTIVPLGRRLVGPVHHANERGRLAALTFPLVGALGGAGQPIGTATKLVVSPL